MAIVYSNGGMYMKSNMPLNLSMEGLTGLRFLQNHV